MAEFANDEEFKTPSQKFITELDALEKYNHREVNNVARMSLFTQFDPLASKSPRLPVSAEEPSTEGQAPPVDEKIEEFNQSTTLIHINATPIKSTMGEPSSINEFTTNGVSDHADLDRHQQIIQMNEEIGILESKNETLELLLGQLMLTHENAVDAALKNISSLQAIISSNKEALASKNQLEEDMNVVEKNYYEIHSRYESLRSIVKEMDNREAQYKTEISVLNNKLKEKELECQKFRSRMEEAIEK